MVKTKTPFLSLGSQGTVGGSLTSQKRGSATLLREKPVPTDPYSLAQAYQRWLYEDYAYLWRQQSLATRQTYATAGSRHHLTGFQYWMKYQLTHLPDILAWWKLDLMSAGQALDSGRLSNNGTIFGASLSSLWINGAYYFDGLNDYVDIPVVLPNYSDFTIEAILRYDSVASRGGVTNRKFAAPFNGSYIGKFDAANIYFQVFDNGGNWIEVTTPHDIGTPHHYLGTLDTLAKTVELFVDGVSVGTHTRPAFTGNIDPPTIDGHVLGVWAPAWMEGIIDNIIIYNRKLDLTTIQRHAARRYPLL